MRRNCKDDQPRSLVIHVTLLVRSKWRHVQIWQLFFGFISILFRSLVVFGDQAAAAYSAIGRTRLLIIGPFPFHDDKEFLCRTPKILLAFFLLNLLTLPPFMRILQTENIENLFSSSTPAISQVATNCTEVRSITVKTQIQVIVICEILVSSANSDMCMSKTKTPT